MKYLVAILLFLLPLTATAQDATPKPLQPNNIEIIDGKKFFSLSNARRQVGSGLSPSAMAVMNHPREDTRIPHSRRLAMTPAGTSSPNSPPTNADSLPWAKPTGPALTGAAAQKADLLSIFAPDDRGSSPVPTKQ